MKGLTRLMTDMELVAGIFRCRFSASKLGDHLVDYFDHLDLGSGRSERRDNIEADNLSMNLVFRFAVPCSYLNSADLAGCRPDMISTCSIPKWKRFLRPTRLLGADLAMATRSHPTSCTNRPLWSSSLTG